MDEKWLEENKEKVTKWGLVGIAGALGIFFLGPILIKMAIDAITLAILGIIGLTLFYLIPDIAEFLASFGWRLFETAIRVDPISRLKRDLVAHKKQIDGLETNISQANAQYLQLKKLLKDQRAMLTADEIAMWEEQIAILGNAGNELIELRNDELRKHDEFCREVDKAEAQYKLGNAFNSALKSFKLAQSAGPNSTGTKIALDEVSKRLAESQSKLTLVLTRPKLIPKIGEAAKALEAPPQTIDITTSTLEKAKA